MNACRMDLSRSPRFRAAQAQSDDGTTSSEGSVDSGYDDNSKRPRAPGTEDENSGAHGSKRSRVDGGDATWEQLQVSTEALGSLQRALYERRTAPALVALVTFGLRTTPYQKPNELLSVVKEKLNSNPGLWKELSKYREALEPSSPCSSQHSDTFGAYCENRQGMWPNDCPVNDMDMMRDFMAFVVTRLQIVRDLCNDHTAPLEGEHKMILNGCLHTWWKHANNYL
mmetsp:Transcript_110002/g.320193  ORF Transcript_110002/g.320193 Transcript_110002/m.320193 type:complete len:226 (-) Transcript_110002:775-1452(-)